MITESDRQALLLVVDDEPGMRDTLSDILEEFAFAVHQAENGIEALAKVQANRYDLVLMDMRMPQMDGAETLRRLRMITPDVPVVMMTAVAEASALDQASDQGAQAILYKPLDIAKLVSLVEKLLHARHEER